ncbi:hypothetical protein CTZ27_35470 [Streptomyces griseocarneus]|nr:hypothetical protein CTZ27_35470 [Streptomyces griseocarneus]
MPSWNSVLRKVAGLPEPETEPAGETAADTAPRPANPWESASAALRDENAARSTAPVKSKPPWVRHEEPKGAVFAKRFGRGLVWTVLVLAAVTGVRSWFVPPKAPRALPAPAQSGAPAYPVAEAAQVAAQFARAYLGVDEAKASDRAAALAAFLPSGADTGMGWDGHGKVDVLAVEPGVVAPGDGRQARVRVDVLIRPVLPPPSEGKSAPESPARWVGLDVPVVAAGGRVLVAGRPGLVGLPKAGPKTPEVPAPKQDAELGLGTRPVVEKFFRAYAGGDTEAVAAPGASVPALPEGLAFKQLDSWTVDAGSGSDRMGTAAVSWMVGTASVTQVYRVELTRVSSSDAQRWQVAAVRGGTS